MKQSPEGKPEVAKVEKKEEEPRDIKEYLAKEVFSNFGVSAVQEKITLSFAPKEKHEIISRSFENARSSTETLFDLETVEGRFDYINYQKEIDRRQAEVLYPYIVDVLRAKDLGDIDLNEAGATSEKVDIGQLRHTLIDAMRQKKLDLKYETEQRISKELEKEGRYKHIIVPTEAEAGDENILNEHFKKFDEQVGVEVKNALAEKEWDENLPDKLQSELIKLKESVPEPSYDDFKKFRSREEVLAELSEEFLRVKNSAFLCLNLTPAKLEQIVQSGEFKGLFSLEEEEVKKHANELSMGDASLYLKQRETTERALGTYSSEQAVIYATLGSKNGNDERFGGARAYGDIFIKLKPEVIKRASFTEGDSLTTVGLTEAVSRKLNKKEVDRLDYKSFALARQISSENAFLAKALVNMERKRELELRGPSNQEFTYLEAHITGGLSIDDFESINIPRRVFENPFESADSGNQRDVILKLQRDEKWRNKIHIVD